MKETTEKTIGQDGRLLCNFFGTLMKKCSIHIDVLLMKKLLIPLPKSVLIPLGLETAASSTDAAIQKKIFKSGII